MKVFYFVIFKKKNTLLIFFLLTKKKIPVGISTGRRKFYEKYSWGWGKLCTVGGINCHSRPLIGNPAHTSYFFLNISPGFHGVPIQERRNLSNPYHPATRQASTRNICKSNKTGFILIVPAKR